jgi:hypothetical protein
MTALYRVRIGPNVYAIVGCLKNSAALVNPRRYGSAYIDRSFNA